MKGFKVICENCGSDNVGICGEYYEDEGSSYSLDCYNCDASYCSFFGDYKPGAVQKK